MPEEIRGFADSKKRSDQNYSRVQEKKKKNRPRHLSIFSLSLFVENCLLFRHVLSRPLYTLCLLPRKIPYRMFNNLHELIERGYRRNKVAAR